MDAHEDGTTSPSRQLEASQAAATAVHALVRESSNVTPALSNLIRDDDPEVHREILFLVAEFLASSPHLPVTTAALREEMDLYTEEDSKHDSEREKLAGRILDGDWIEAERMLLASPTMVRTPKAFLYQLYRENFLELVEAREAQKAFTLLLRKLKPLEHFQARPNEFHELSYLLSARAVSEAGGSFEGWGGPIEGREDLVESLRMMSGSLTRKTTEKGKNAAPPDVPPGRLVTLLQQAAAWQVATSRSTVTLPPRISSLLRDYAPDVVPNRLQTTFQTHTANVKCVRFLGDDGRRIISGSSDSTISIVASDDTPLLSGPIRLTGHRSRVWSVDSTPDGRLAASASGDGDVRIWETEDTGRCLSILKDTDGHGDVYSVSWSRGKSTIIAGGYDKILRLWDVESGALEKTFTGHSHPVTSTDFNQTGRVLVSGGKDRNVKLWDVASGISIASIPGALGEITSVALDPVAGHLLLASSRDNSNSLYDVRMLSANRKILRLIHHQNTSRAHIRSSFAREGLIVGGSEDGLVYLWSSLPSQSAADAASASSTTWNPSSFIKRGREGGVGEGGGERAGTRAPLETLQGHRKGAVFEVRWNDAREMLVSCGEDRTVRTWTHQDP